MQRPKWLIEWGDGKKVFEGMLVIDVPDVKVVEARFDNEIVLIAIGVSKQLTAEPPERTAAQNEGMGKSNMKWKIFYDKTIFPEFIPVEKVRDFMAGVVAIVSKSASVYNSNTLYIAIGKRPSKGNAPFLLDYEIAKKIEEAKSFR